MTRRDATTTCLAPSNWREHTSKDMPPIPLPPEDDARVLAARDRVLAPWFEEIATTWVTVEEEDERLRHHHGRLTVLGRSVHIESLGGTFSGPWRSVGHLFVHANGVLVGYGYRVSCTLGFGGSRPAKAAIRNATLVVEHTRGPVRLYR